jgi:heme exporter protein D
MEWGSWSEFWAMGGYGLYVWGSYLATLIGLAAEVVILRRRRRTLVEHLSLTTLNTQSEKPYETKA